MLKAPSDMETTLKAILAFFVLVLAGSWPAAAAHGPAAGPPCTDRAEALRQLSEGYQEVPTGAGISQKNFLVELFLSPTGETWTLVMTDPKTGRSCAMASGSNWRPLTRAPLGDAT